MANCKILFVFALISISLSVYCDSSMEKIIGGQPSFQANHKYHVAVVGRHNKSNILHIACSGGILSDFYILSNAECLFNTREELMKLRFYILAGFINLKYGVSAERNVLYIYSYTKTPLTNNHYVAVLQVQSDYPTSLVVLVLPIKGRPLVFERQLCIAGYGLSSMEQKINNTGKPRPKVTWERNIELLYAFVDIVSNKACHRSYPYINPKKEMCGKIKARFEKEQRGLCKYDEGGPLVLDDDVVLGISNRPRDDCNNTVHGNIYTRVSYYIDFINGILSENYLNGTVRHNNRYHIGRIYS